MSIFPEIKRIRKSETRGIHIRSSIHIYIHIWKTYSKGVLENQRKHDRIMVLFDDSVNNEAELTGDQPCIPYGMLESHSRANNLSLRTPPSDLISPPPVRL